MSIPRFSAYPIVLSTPTLRTILPYQHSIETNLFQNHHCLGYGLQLRLQKSIAMQTVQGVIQELISTLPCEHRYSLMIHHHRYAQHNISAYQYYLFVSSQIQQRDELTHHRTQVRACLARQHIKSLDLHSNDFLIFLRTLVSPTIENTQGAGLIDIQNKPFHDVIPNPGTIFTLDCQHIDIISANALGLFKKIRVLPNHIDPIVKEASLWAPIHDMFQYSNCDWFVSLTLTTDPTRPLANFILMTPPQHTHNNLLNISKHYTDYGLALRPALSPLQTFLASLPFGFIESDVNYRS